MVNKAERLKKEKRTREKRGRSICVKIHKKVKANILAQLLPTIHDSIEHVNFPRQDPPKFAFIVCNELDKVHEVTEAIKTFKNPDVGFLKPKTGPRPEKPQRPRALISPRQTEIDLLTLVLNTPDNITQRMVEQLTPNFKKITPINSGKVLTYMIQFGTPEKAFDAFEDITTSAVQDITVRYLKKKVKSPPSTLSQVNTSAPEDGSDSDS